MTYAMSRRTQRGTYLTSVMVAESVTKSEQGRRFEQDENDER